jgi:hypothetical protein
MIKQKVELSKSLCSEYFEVRLNLLGIKYKRLPDNKDNYVYMVEGYPSDLIQVGIVISDTKHYAGYSYHSEITSIEDFNFELDILLNRLKELGLYMFDTQNYKTLFICDFEPKQMDLDTVVKLFVKLAEKALIDEYDHIYTFLCKKGDITLFLATK